MVGVGREVMTPSVRDQDNVRSAFTHRAEQVDRKSRVTAEQAGDDHIVRASSGNLVREAGIDQMRVVMDIGQ